MVAVVGQLLKELKCQTERLKAQDATIVSFWEGQLTLIAEPGPC